MGVGARVYRIVAMYYYLFTKYSYIDFLREMGNGQDKS
jgi:hypothetical protein